MPAAQDYRVHLKHLDGSTEKVPYFCLPANELNDVIAPSCYSCFDYPNALADLARAPVLGTCFVADARASTACLLYSRRACKHCQ